MDASRATWKRDLNPLTAKVHDGVCKVVLTIFQYVDKIVCCYHPNETSAVVLSHGNNIFQHFTK